MTAPDKTVRTDSRESPLTGKSVCRVVTVPFFVYAHLRRQLYFLKETGMDVVVVSSDGPERKKISTQNGLAYHCIDIPRSIHPARDLIALIRLFKFFRKKKFDIVHSTTPKAGLLSAIAGYLAGIRIRLHTWTGQQWVTLAGPVRFLSRLSDRLIGRLNTRCYADSRSQRKFLISEGIVRTDKIAVIGFNSLTGVDLNRFKQDDLAKQQKSSIRGTLGIKAGSAVILFVGRIARDKGIVELVKAFEMLSANGYKADLILVGPFDQERGGRATLSKKLFHNKPHIHLTGYTPEPERYMAIADIFCLPSYREGFPTVVIEAGAMKVPTVATRITGLVDAVDDGQTGLLVPPRDETALMQALKRLLDDPQLASQMGRRAHQRCLRYFSAETINGALLEEYARLLKIHPSDRKPVLSNAQP